jgi:hypothetical protein
MKGRHWMTGALAAAAMALAGAACEKNRASENTTPSNQSETIAPAATQSQPTTTVPADPAERQPVSGSDDTMGTGHGTGTTTTDPTGTGSDTTTDPTGTGTGTTTPPDTTTTDPTKTTPDETTPPREGTTTPPDDTTDTTDDTQKPPSPNPY